MISEAKRASAIANLAKAMEANRTRPSTAVEKICAKCGKAWKVKRSHADKITYCSKECMGDDYKNRMTGDANPNYRAAGRKCCVGCGNEFKSYNKSRKFCSHTCYVKNAPPMPEKFGRGAVDHNQGHIVKALLSMGAGVISMTQLGRGIPDLLCCYEDRLVLMEVKNPTNAYGRRGLSPSQQKWADNWPGERPVVVRSVYEACAALGMIKEGAD